MTTKNQNYNDKEKTIIQQLVYFKRNQFEYTYQQVIDLLNEEISIQSLHDFEKGKRFTTQDNLSHLFNTLDIQFDTSTKLVENAQQDFYQLIDRYLNYSDEIPSLINNYLNHKEYLESFAFPYYLCAYCLNLVYCHRDEVVPNYISTLLEDLESDDKIIHLVIYHIHYMILFNNQSFTLMPQLYKNALSYYISPHSDEPKVIKGLLGLYYLQKCITLANIEPLTCLDEIDMAAKAFEICGYPILFVAALDGKAIVYERLNNYTRAFHFHKIAQQKSAILPYNLTSWLYSNTLKFYVAANQHELVQEIMNKPYSFTSFHYLMALIDSYLSDDQNKVNFYRNNINNTNDKITLSILRLIDLILENRKDRAIKLTAVLLADSKVNDTILYQVILKVMIHYCKTNHHQKLLVAYQQLYIDVLTKVY